jgi:hypothetical protein
MGYSLTPIVVVLSQVKALMGSKNVAVLQEVIQKYRNEMLSTDAMGEGFDEFEAEIQADYKRFVNGDFSTVDLNATYPEPEDDEEEEDDEETAAFRAKYERLNETDPEAAKRLLLKHLQEAFENDFDDDEEEEEDDDEVVKEVTTGTALAHLILGGQCDKSHGYKYGYALYHLCEHLGEIPDHDAWCSMRSSANVDSRVDKVLKRAGVGPATFTVSKFLINRGSPVPIPKPHDFPFIGYLTREEIREILPLLTPAKLDAAIRSAPDDDRDWIGENIDDLRQWLELCAETNRDLVCFYY